MDHLAGELLWDTSGDLRFGFDCLEAMKHYFIARIHKLTPSGRQQTAVIVILPDATILCSNRGGVHRYIPHKNLRAAVLYPRGRMVLHVHNEHDLLLVSPQAGKIVLVLIQLIDSLGLNSLQVRHEEEGVVMESLTLRPSGQYQSTVPLALQQDIRRCMVSLAKQASVKARDLLGAAATAAGVDGGAVNVDDFGQHHPAMMTSSSSSSPSAKKRVEFSPAGATTSASAADASNRSLLDLAVGGGNGGDVGKSPERGSKTTRKNLGGSNGGDTSPKFTAAATMAAARKRAAETQNTSINFDNNNSSAVNVTNSVNNNSQQHHHHPLSSFGHRVVGTDGNQSSMLNVNTSSVGTSGVKPMPNILGTGRGGQSSGVRGGAYQQEGAAAASRHADAMSSFLSHQQHGEETPLDDDLTVLVVQNRASIITFPCVVSVWRYLKYISQHLPGGRQAPTATVTNLEGDVSSSSDASHQAPVVINVTLLFQTMAMATLKMPHVVTFQRTKDSDGFHLEASIFWRPANESGSGGAAMNMGLGTGLSDGATFLRASNSS